jgi:hypothetical protein
VESAIKGRADARGGTEAPHPHPARTVSRRRCVPGTTPMLESASAPPPAAAQSEPGPANAGRATS